MTDTLEHSVRSLLSPGRRVTFTRLSDSEYVGVRIEFIGGGEMEVQAHESELAAAVDDLRKLFPVLRHATQTTTT